MHRVHLLLLAGTALLPLSPAQAADTLKFGPAPSWVVPQPILPASSKLSDAPVALLLHDQQIMLNPGKISTFAELALKFQKPEGLSAGNVSFSWNPATDTVTVHKLEIRRGDRVIDVLGSGQTFTIMRRESNLELATLDGVLTATIQPEGLQEGDIVVLETTTDHADPVLKGHVEALFAPWTQTQIRLAHARVAWPSGLDVQVRKSGDLPPAQQAARDGQKSFELTMRDVDPVISPKGAPARFKIGRIGEATDFRSWAEAARLMMPLYRDAAVVAPSGPLREEVEKIRRASTDPKTRAAQALQLVGQRVRYVALLIGDGGYVPASAETSWSRRFGDCKAKTALLLAILHELGIEAAPVLVNSGVGDVIAERLPSIGLFDHVLVRASVGGKTYWLDGTRTGDTTLDSIEVPNFRWGLPLIENAQLVQIVSPPLDLPATERWVDVDATAGVLAPAKITIREVYRGDDAVAINALYSQLSAGQRDEALRDGARKYFDGFAMSSSSLEFDKAGRKVDLRINGAAKLGWKDEWLSVPISSIAFDPNFERTAGPFRDAPMAVSHPRFIRDTATLRLPAGFAAQQVLDAPVKETLAGVEYFRTETVSGDTITVVSSERSVVPEVPYKDALAAEPRLRALDKDDVYLRMASSYRPKDADSAALASETPSSAPEFLMHGWMMLGRGRFDDAIADFSNAAAAQPTNAAPLASRAIAYASKDDFAMAEKDVASAQALDPNNPMASTALGLVADRKGDCRTAVAAYTKSLRDMPSNSYALGHRANCQRKMGNNEAALSDSELALKADPTLMDLRVMRANILLGQGNRDAVAREAELMMQQNPKDDYAFVAAGKIYARIERPADAMKAYDRALAIEPSAYIYINRAQSRPASDRKGRLADLDAALKLEPANADALAEKADQLADQGDFKAAVQLYGQAFNAEPDNLHLNTRRAVMMFKAGNEEGARKILAEQRTKAKTSDELNALCWTKATAGILLEDAAKDCQDALRIDPEAGPIIDSLAFVMLRLGKLDEAIASYDRAITKRTGAASYMGRALAYARKGDKAHAQADRAQALKMDPGAEARFADYGLKLDEASATAGRASRP